MSATNDDAVSNQAAGGGSGEFSAKRAGDEPLMTSGVRTEKALEQDNRC